MDKRRGRPKKIDSRTEQYRLRMNKEESFWLNQLCKNEGLSKADALRTLIKMGYDSLVIKVTRRDGNNFDVSFTDFANRMLNGLTTDYAAYEVV